MVLEWCWCWNGGGWKLLTATELFVQGTRPVTRSSAPIKASGGRAVARVGPAVRRGNNYLCPFYQVGRQ